MSAQSRPVSRSFARRRVWALSVSPVVMGGVAGLLAVVGGAFFAINPPEAYGLCMACHARDLLNWSLNHALGTKLTVAAASAVFPLLTVVGVLIGASLAAITSGEFRLRTFDNPLKTFGLGALVMNFALLAAGCSFRLALRAANGEPLGLVGFGAFCLGVIGAALWLKRETLR